MADRDNLQASLERLDAIHPTKLPVDTLKELQTSVRSQYSALAERARASADKATAALNQSDPQVLGFVVAETARLRSQEEVLDDLDAKLDDHIQRNIIQTRMIERLGSAHRVVFMEGFVMSLIVVVLSLLVYDLGVPAANRLSWLSRENIFVIDAVCCAVFMAEFLFRLSCADSKRYVWRHHWVDFVTSIPVPDFQMARFGRFARVARFARLARFLRFVRVFFILWRGMDKLQDVVDVKMMKKTVRWAVAATVLGALLIYRLEGWEGGDSPVGNMMLAMWWSFTTVLTGGFGDIHNPVSIAGQILTAVLVVTGMVFVGVFTATLTSLFVGEQSEELERLQDELGEKIDRVARRVEDLGGG